MIIPERLFHNISIATEKLHVLPSALESPENVGSVKSFSLFDLTGLASTGWTFFLDMLDSGY